MNSFPFTLKPWDRKEVNFEGKANNAMYCWENVLLVLATGAQRPPPEALEAVMEKYL